MPAFAPVERPATGLDFNFGGGDDVGDALCVAYVVEEELFEDAELVVVRDVLDAEDELEVCVAADARLEEGNLPAKMQT